MKRRHSRVRALVAGLSVFAVFLLQAEKTEHTVPIKWLSNESPGLTTGVSFGVPWLQGEAKVDDTFSLSSDSGKILQTQTWPLAYWPDGSLKWLGVATVAGMEADTAFQLTHRSEQATEESGDSGIQVRTSDTTYTIDSGSIQIRIPMAGDNLIESIVKDGVEVSRKGQLICVLQHGSGDELDASPQKELFNSHIDKVSIEQSGPLRAVVKIEGVHKGLQSARTWLPFVVRLYLYAGSDDIRLVHSIVYDGDQEVDFIRGLGIQFEVPMREQIHNRHVAFSGQDDGLWMEPIQPMVGRGGRFVADPETGEDLYDTQLKGERVLNYEEVDARGQGWLADWAVWDDFKLTQPNSNGFTIEKRTNAQSCWLHTAEGKRASGLVYAGDVTGGLAVSMKDFWQSCPSALEVRHASSGAAKVIAWFWSPDAPAMDMRHYDLRAHGLQAVYEDVQPGFSTATGMARTSEISLFPTTSVPARETLAKCADLGATPPLLVCTPEYLHNAKAFGYWGLEDRSTPARIKIEDQLAYTLDFYLTQPEQHHWYGFWDFGDVMHSYDRGRNEWRYDLGGMAWDNSELGTDMWLWYSFLRTGREDVFRMAEAMTRHTGEVDCYHLGRFAGLGSRHNVRHWGCGAKEARISQAAYRRYYYYLTTDERIGDVMREMVNVDFQTVEFDPMRLAQPITEEEKKLAPTRVRLGPDWFAFISNWMTEWERTGNTEWRDKILAGVESLDAMPLGLRSGKNLVFGYDPATGNLFQLSDEAGVYNLATIMGGAEVVFELNMMLDDPRWDRLWLQYCRLYNAPKELVEKDMETGVEGMDATQVRDGRLAAYVYHVTGNDAFKEAAIKSLARPRRRGPEGDEEGPKELSGPIVLNPIDEGPAGTNGAAQMGLETIAILGLLDGQIPEILPEVPMERPNFPPRPGGPAPKK